MSAATDSREHLDFQLAFIISLRHFVFSISGIITFKEEAFEQSDVTNAEVSEN